MGIFTSSGVESEVNMEYFTVNIELGEWPSWSVVMWLLSNQIFMSRAIACVAQCTWKGAVPCRNGQAMTHCMTPSKEVSQLCKAGVARPVRLVPKRTWELGPSAKPLTAISRAQTLC